ncbi:MarR family winged helix-turn-helix transcriptional regulator [Actinocrispum wychmicini]|uniref:DNA-binding MarR family transcriptional regulator n=1 Tax=Actinocrispum wychmicini TaxID=1213861 RepID=A0A4V2S811_9PSEU|nr:MarR family transcriptional regulator [Actinocrispum wychmicini]TCO62070.1 DNA-binding MarR family transcriptional regulator [Actinocrispum wychmicini]
MATFTDPRLTVIGLLVEVHGGLMARLDKVHATAGFSGTDFDVLIRLARSPGHRLRMSDLAAQTALSTSGVTRIVDRLEHRGLLTRQLSSDDRRSLLAVLTDEGLDRLTAHLPGLFAAIDSALVDVLTLQELDQLVGTFRMLREHLHPDATAGAH